MPVQIKFDPHITMPQVAIIQDATEQNDGIMTAAMVRKLDSLSPGGSGPTYFTPVTATSSSGVDYAQMLLGDASGGTFNVSLPLPSDASPTVGNTFIVKNVGAANNIGLRRHVGTTIDGPGTLGPGEWVIYVSDGVSGFICVSTNVPVTEASIVYWNPGDVWDTTVRPALEAAVAEFGAATLWINAPSDFGATQFTMDTPTDLDSVSVFCPNLDTAFLNMDGTFVHTGSGFLNLTNITLTAKVNMGSFNDVFWNLERTTIEAGAGHNSIISMNPGGTILCLMNRSGSQTTGADKLILLGQGATAEFALLGGSTLTAGVVALDVGATVATVAVQADATIHPLPSFEAGITLAPVAVGGDAFFGQYQATTATDWAASTPPTNIGDALDRLAAACTALGHAP